MNERRNLLQESLLAIERLQARLENSESRLHEPLAIVGAGCRYPGGIETPDALWRTVRDGTNAVAEIPADRWDSEAFYSSDPKAAGKMITRRGGFLRQVDLFDPQFFGISPREAMSLDPQQRLLLETASEALESAGIATDGLVGSRTGVFVGITTGDYMQLMRAAGTLGTDVYAATGSALNAAAGRISFTFGLQGPCVSLDTACSSSLVAVHMACQSLRAGECQLALAGGVNVVLTPEAMVMFSKWGMLAPDGACKTFDAAADGFVRAEGCAVIALKRLSDALAADDPILGVIRGSAVNSDGHSSGLTVPNGPAQQAVIRSALANARLEPADIDYVEAHGTGTQLGDPIEVEALAAVMSTGHSQTRPLRVGSIKTNLGHTEAASGLAGLLKVMMSLRHEAIPPHLHFAMPNPGIAWQDMPLQVPTRLTPWPRAGVPRRAGVSSFGFSGTNAHVILEEAPLIEHGDIVETGRCYLLPLSGRDEPALRKVAQRLLERAQSPEPPALADVARTLSLGRAHLARRSTMLCESLDDLRDQLRGIAAGTKSIADGSVRPGQSPRIAFLFTGQGSQYAGMGRQLYEAEPVFRAVLDRAAKALEGSLERRLLDVMFGANSERLSQTAYTQPALFALEYALAELWRSWGVAPSIVAGHSVGEYAAACVAGVFDFEEGLGLIAERGRLIQALPAGGGMIAVFSDEGTIAAALEDHGRTLSIAAINGPQEIVVSGDVAALALLSERFERQGIASRPLDVSHAFHSQRLDPMLGALEAAAAAVPHKPPRLSLLSNVTGAAFTTGSGPDAHYWRQHAREPVRFAAGMQSLKNAGANVIVEIGPHPTLLTLVSRTDAAASWRTASSLRRGRPERREMLQAAATLHASGASLRWEALGDGQGGHRIALPTYPFQRQRYWFTPASGAAVPEPADVHPLLGARRELAGFQGAFCWEREISVDRLVWLNDHRVQGAVIFPATAYVEMALAAAEQIWGSGSLSVSAIENRKPIILADAATYRIQATLRVQEDGSALFSVHGQQRESWTEHMSARLRRVATPETIDGVNPALAEARAAAGAELSGERFYEALARKGNQWGACFQGLRQLWCCDGEAIGRAEVPAVLAAEMHRYRFHPAVADACGHTLVATVPLEDSDGVPRGAFVGGGIGEAIFHRSPRGTILWSHARLRPRADNEPEHVLVGDLWTYDESGALVSETREARLWYLEEGRRDASPLGASDYYVPRWIRQPLGSDGRRQPRVGPWIVFADSKGVAARIAARREAAGLETVLVSPGHGWSVSGERITIRASSAEDYERLLTVVGQPAVILHLWSLDQPAAASDDLSQLEAHRGESALQLLHALRHAASAPRPRLWLVTRASQMTSDTDACEAPWDATLWGLGRALSQEHGELWGGLIDLPAQIDAQVHAAALLAEVETATAEDKIAFRAADRLVARLERREGSVGGKPPFAVRSDGAYLVTGGLGGMGLAMARWLVERGARHLLLLGRKSLPPRDAWSRTDVASADTARIEAIIAMEALGARVTIAAVDVADRDSLQQCLETWNQAGNPAIRGVIHAAGIAQFEALESQSVASLRLGMVAKLQGAWHLHRLFQSADLDFFAMCSSTSALLSSPLLGGYAAGNAFMDSLAHYRRGRGLAGLSINWGTWREVGMAVHAGQSTSGQMLNGMRTLSNAEGLSAFEELLSSGDAQAAVLPVDWAELARSYRVFARDPFLALHVTASRGEGMPSAALTSAAVLALSGDARDSALREYLHAEAGRALGLEVTQLDAEAPLSSFGFDSLMAVQLKNRIEADLGVIVPMMQFLQGPSVSQIVNTVSAAIDRLAREPAGLSSAAAAASVWEEGSL